MFLKRIGMPLLTLLLLLLTTLCPSTSLGATTSCMALYSSANSIFFGKLLKQSRTKEELEFLNAWSSSNLQFNTKPQPEEHMINSLIFYRRAIEININEMVLPKEMYIYILDNSLPLIEKNPKFLFFEKYLRNF